MKQIEGHPNYSITEDGRVWSCERTCFTANGGCREIEGKWLTPSLNKKNGYLYVSLSIPSYTTTSGKIKSNMIKPVHKLVAEAYLPTTENKIEINHKDFNKQNNNVSNLEWVSKSENSQHAADGFRSGRSKEELQAFVDWWNEDPYRGRRCEKYGQWTFFQVKAACDRLKIPHPKCPLYRKEAVEKIKKYLIECEEYKLACRYKGHQKELSKRRIKLIEELNVHFNTFYSMIKYVKRNEK